MSEVVRRRESFAEVAATYDRARPRYPSAVFDELARLTGPPLGRRVLEVGCGTGQATADLAARGYDVLGVELEPAMATLARRRVHAQPNARVETGEFESWDSRGRRFDLVVSATAFHWIDPAVRYTKAADLLRPGGRLAILHSFHVEGGTPGFFEATQRFYRAAFPSSSSRFSLPPNDRPDECVAELEASGRFLPPSLRLYPWEAAYTRAEYLDLLDTYSDHRALAPERRADLFAGLGELIDGRFGGKIRKAYLTELIVAAPRSSTSTETNT